MPTFVSMIMTPTDAWRALPRTDGERWLRDTIATLTETVVQTPERPQGVIWAHALRGGDGEPLAVNMLWMFFDDDIAAAIANAMQADRVRAYFAVTTFGGPAITSQQALFEPFLAFTRAT